MFDFNEAISEGQALAKGHFQDPCSTPTPTPPNRTLWERRSDDRNQPFDLGSGHTTTGEDRRWPWGGRHNAEEEVL